MSSLFSCTQFNLQDDDLELKHKGRGFGIGMKNKTYGSDRVCKKTGNKLSTYNPNDKCFYLTAWKTNKEMMRWRYVMMKIRQDVT